MDDKEEDGEGGDGDDAPAVEIPAEVAAAATTPPVNRN